MGEPTEHQPGRRVERRPGDRSWTTTGAVLLAIVLVAVLGGIALRRVQSDWSDRRDALADVVVSPDANVGPGPTDDVAIVGDSITEMSESTVHAELDPHYHVRIQGRGGYRVEEMEPYGIELAESKPEQVIINLGTNDVLTNWPSDKSTAALKRVLADFAGARCIHVVTINEAILSTSSPGVDARAFVFNFGLRQLAADERLDVIDWAKAVKDDLAAGSPDGPLTSDSVHPNATGQKLLATLYHRALDACTG
jgi:hypothetical protein